VVGVEFKYMPLDPIFWLFLLRTVRQHVVGIALT